jgi:thiol reductant ABC exporter CydC subunit
VTRAERVALRRVVAVAPPDARLAAATVACGAAAVLAGVALLGLSGALISKAALRPPVLSLSVLIVTVRAAGLVRALARYGERLVSHDLALRALGRLRSAFFARLVPLVPAGLRAAPGDLLARFVGDVDQLQALYLRALAPPLTAALSGAVAVAAAFVLLPSAGAVLAAGLLAAGVGVPPAVAAVARRAGRRQAAARARLSGEVLELARFGEELAVLGRTEERVARVVAADVALRRLALRDALAGAAASGLSALAQGAAVVGTLVVAIPAVHGGRLDAILLAALVFVTLAAFEATAPLPAAAQQLAACASAAARLTAVLGAPAPVRDPDEPGALPAAGDLALERVTLAWDGRAPLLDGVDLCVHPGEAVALVGPSGAGKTTLAQLLVRLRDPDGGRVSLGGVDIRSLRQADLRAAVRLIASDEAVFTTTLAANVRLARPAASDDEIRRALHDVGLGPWLDALPAGLDTLVGEDGCTLSGGQRRRLAVARALLCDARFLIVDEPSAHLDGAAAEALLARLAAHARSRGQGLLAIVHGPGDLEAFDRVVELRAGQLGS